jgi:hypothetical protein
MNKKVNGKSLEEFNPKDISKVSIVHFTPARVHMLKECDRHPVLVAQIVQLGADPEWGSMIGEIAAYCNVFMDGVYSNDDLEVLYPQLTKRMTDTRLSANSGIILIN